MGILIVKFIDGSIERYNCETFRYGLKYVILKDHYYNDVAVLPKENVLWLKWGKDKED